MFRRLFFNTILSAFGFAATSIVSIVLVPFLIGSYGLAEFGLITLARILLPTGAMAIFDFGYSEIATQTVASARELGKWSRAGGRLAGLAMIALIVGIAVSIGMWLGAAQIVAVLNTGAERAAAFELVIRVTALAFAPLLVAMVIEGTVRGFESFGALRMIEVMCAILYGLTACALVYLGFGFQWIALAYLASVLVRAAALALTAYILSDRVGLRLASTARDDWRDLSERCRIMAWNKMLGAFQAQAAPLLIASVLGPARVGVYDILVRLPRFTKTVLGNLNYALLPVAARLDASDDRAGMQRLGETGLLVVAAVVAPVALGGVVFSPPFLELWVGPDFRALWQWHALMFVVPLLTALVSFGGTALLGRHRIVAMFNVISTAQIVIQFGLAAALVNAWGERAFILGQVSAVAVTFPFQLRLIAKQQGLSVPSLLKVANVCALVSGLSGSAILIGVSSLTRGWIGLVVGATVWLIVCYVAIAFLVLSKDERQRIGRVAGQWSQGSMRIFGRVAK